MHDGSVDRTTNGSGQISKMDFNAIRQLDAGSWFHQDFSGEKVPLLSELLNLCRDKMNLMIEIKDEGIEDDVYKIVDAAGMLDQATIISFQKAVGIRLRSLNPAVPFGRLIWLDKPVLHEEAEILAKKLIAENASILSVNYQVATQELVNVMHAHNIPVSVWTIDNEADIRRMAEIDVDMITSNRITLLIDTLTGMR
jgi:glycerophosphoryl diester phosphodiesterase